MMLNFKARLFNGRFSISSFGKQLETAWINSGSHQLGWWVTMQSV